MVEESVEEMSIDGGKVRIRTPKGKICRWQDYKAVNLHGHCCSAFLQENERLVKWVNEREFGLSKRNQSWLKIKGWLLRLMAVGN